MKTRIAHIFQRISYRRLVVYSVLGGILGYIYYATIGCDNGSCAISSSPTNSILYGILVVNTLFYRNKKQAKSTEQKATGN
jgi:uncharacterized membrane protein YdjX (TVP38/TMEM64 family)